MRYCDIKKRLCLAALAAILILPLPAFAVSCGTGGEPDGSAGITDTDADTDTAAPAESMSGDTAAGQEKKTMQLIPDVKFEQGITLLSQKDHAKNDKVTTLGTHSFYGGTVSGTRWQLAQWDSGPCLIANRVITDNSEITDGRWRSFRYDIAEGAMTFHLDTSLYYGGKAAVQGDYWPHLLIEQSSFGYSRLPVSDRAFYSCGAERMILSFDIRLDSYSVTPVAGDWVNAAQFLMYFYVRGTGTKDFCWFGVQLFDNRWQYNDNYIGYDGGKPDASGAMIYSVGSKYVYSDAATLWAGGAPAPGGYVHVELDLAPHLRQMFEKGRADGYFKTSSLDRLYIDGMNLGWETIATSDITVTVRNLSLDSYLAD